MNMLKLGMISGAMFIAAQNFLQGASNDPTTILQKALFEEEANHDLPAAIQGYQSVIAGFEKERKLAATAVFRLGECYRKQGNTNDAITQYERVLQEFPDQPSLVTFSRQNLAELGSAPAPITAGTPGKAIAVVPATSIETEEVRRIEAMIKDSPDLINAKDNSGMSPLNLAAMRGQLVVATFLLNNGAEVNSKDGDGRTPLHWAAAKGHKALVELLLDHKADVQAVDGHGRTPLHEAAQKGYRSLLEVLLAHKAQVNAKTPDGVTALHLAVANGFKAIAEVLLQNGAEVNALASNVPNPAGGIFSGTPLHIAAARGDQAMAELLLANRANPNSQLSDGLTPLHVAAIYGHDAIASTLIAHGAEVNATVTSRATPLASAVTGGKPLLARVLLAAKADPNIPFRVGDNRFRSPLFAAVETKNPELVELLLKNGANPNVRDEAAGNETPLLAAVRNEKADIVSLLLEAKADPNIPNSEGWAPLHWAIGQSAVLERLLSAGAKVDARNKRGEAPLHCAAGCGLKPATEMLLDHGAEIEGRDNMGNTPLHYATLAGRKELVDFLLTKGANPNLANDEGETPLNWTKSSPGGMGYNLPGASFVQPSRRGLSGIPGMPIPRYPPGPAPGAYPAEALPGAIGKIDDRSSIETALKSHGALEVLPQLDRIQVTRPLANYSQTVFSQGSNDWNQMTLLEALAVQYQLLTAQTDGEPGQRYDSRSLGMQSLSFPDISRLRVRHPESNLTSWHERTIDLEPTLEQGDCGKDVPLAWGDVVEIPEADHPLNEKWQGFSLAEFQNFKKCLTREIQVTVKGRTTKLTLSPDIIISPVPGDYNSTTIGTKVPFWIAPALRGSNLLLASSDTSRIKVTRRDAATGQTREWILDCSPGKPAPAFWLRNGDAIDVPEKN